MMSLLTLLIIATSSIVSADSLQDKTEKLHLNTIVNAEVIKRKEPKYPVKAVQNGHEGWVQLSFVVEPDGTTSNVLVEDSSNNIFEKEAKKAIKAWRYSPATNNGKAIQQCRNQVQLSFRLSSTPRVSKSFKRSYQQIEKLLAQGEVDQADLILVEMKSEGRKNAKEDLSYLLLTNQMAAKQGDKKEELKSLESILFQYNEYLKDTDYSNLSMRAFQLALDSRAYSNAKSIYEAFEAKYPEHEKLSILTPYYTEVIEYFKSDKPIIADGKIGGRKFWRYNMSRNAFIIDEVQGQLTNLEIRCENNMSQFLVEAGSEWKIPQSWGQCSVYVFGDSDASFMFAEVNNNKSNI